ncbi:Calcium-binding mitochondrial carrier protein Aralar1 isoform X1 [Oopsacas minuta]|uniref:Calcium-binding mitochondrial carrier protein Aralar1 isoform X1 n=1 Tax=Oopsacas minuta TaxID=111878 RepID=A0AAV7KE41_9METZ|nr:Calcium-binding mitochondrial carrier protein Aralar1 isoform X1 [Oopsacas minuta]
MEDPFVKKNTLQFASLIHYSFNFFIIALLADTLLLHRIQYDHAGKYVLELRSQLSYHSTFDVSYLSFTQQRIMTDISRHSWLTPPQPIARTKRAPTEKLEEVYRTYSTGVGENGDKFMTEIDFSCQFLQILHQDTPHKTIELISNTIRHCGANSSSNKGQITLQDFQTLESILNSPDATFRLAFNIFDVCKTGRITYQEFCNTLTQFPLYKNIRVMDIPDARLYFGDKLDNSLDYTGFCQLITQLSRELTSQLFTSNTHSIKLSTFLATFRPILSPFVLANLPLIFTEQGSTISYTQAHALTGLFTNLELLQVAVESSLDSHGVVGKEVTRDQLMSATEHFPQITPLQVDLLFKICNLERQTGTIRLSDFYQVLPRGHDLYPQSKPISSTQPVNFEVAEGFWWGVAINVYRFSLAAVGGCAGATAVYPIDLVKTRLQNQRGSLAGEIMYKNSVDCFIKVVRHEGILGLYRGLLPQLMGVSPEKAIKLTVNDMVRSFMADKNGKITLPGEILAGACAGTSQVIFTNPIEIVKIRLQVAGEMQTTARVGAWQIAKDLGLLGLYKGARACLLRDAPFSAIYFTTYAHVKAMLANEDGHNEPISLFASGMIAGVPAAGLLTPADVIKTRLQVQAREGQMTYSGLIDCAKKIWKYEGHNAFWKGAPARVFRSSPQFGVTLLTYELLQRYIKFENITGRAIPHHEAAPVSSLEKIPDAHIGGYRLAVTTFSRLESKFGLYLPKFS